MVGDGGARMDRVDDEGEEDVAVADDEAEAVVDDVDDDTEDSSHD